jgi:hypothetical protein
MKVILAIAAMFLVAGAATPQQPKEDYGLPELHKIKTVTLSPSYSCRTPEDRHKGYMNAALFLSKYSDQRNAPDLLFNGACKSEDYFQGSTAGDDMSLITDLGEGLPLEDASAQVAFNRSGVVGGNSTFAKDAKVKPKHTYAVLINKGEIRGLFVFTVDEFVPDKSVRLRYAVKEYQVLSTIAQSERFSWDTGNRDPSKCDCDK